MVANKPPFCHMIRNFLTGIRKIFSNPIEKWAFVGSIPAPVSRYEEKGTLYYHLFESNRGRRKYECQCTISLIRRDQLEREHKNMVEYNEKVLPWMWGHFIEGISTYNTVSQDILIEKLSLP